MFKIETVSHLDMTETIVNKTVCDQTFEIATGQQQPLLLYDAKTEKMRSLPTFNYVNLS